MSTEKTANAVHGPAHILIKRAIEEAHLIRSPDGKWWAWCVFGQTGEKLHAGYGETSQLAAQQKAEEHMS